MLNDSVEIKLKNIKRWNFVPGKNRILPVLEKVIGKDENIIDVIDGFFRETPETVYDINDSGLILITDSRIIIIKSAAPERYISLKKNRKLNISFIKNFSSLAVKIESGKDSYNFVTHVSENELKKKLSSTASVSADGHSMTKNSAPEYINFSQCIPVNETDKQHIVPDFLYSETEKITEKLNEFRKSVPEIKLMDMFRNDIYTLSGMCLVDGREISNKESLFICMIISASMDAIRPSFNAKDKEKLASEINRIINNPVKKLESLEYLNAFDLEQGTKYSDKMASIFYEFSQCLLKADGIIDGREENLLKDISELIQKAKQPESSSAEIPADEEETIEQVMEKINALVGMENIKDEIKSFINYVNIRQEREKRKLPVTPLTLHAVFYGPPGTGKTTIARLLGSVYKALGLLKSGHLIETDRSGLVAGYVGQTAIKTDELVIKAKDGVLFIDEAYTLIPENSSNDFGKEAVDTILKRMEDMRDNFAVIAAGYTDEMERFINSNPGLKSRFSRYFYFNHYTPEELTKIFYIFSDNVEFKLSDNAAAKLKDIITLYYNKRNRSFGNARFVRNIFDKIIQNQADRLATLKSLTSDLLCEIKIDDIPDETDLSPQQFS